MAATVQFHNTSISGCYAIIRHPNLQAWNETRSELEDYGTGGAVYADYAITVNEFTNEFWGLSVPEGLPAGWYYITFFDPMGMSPATYNLSVNSQFLYWDGDTISLSEGGGGGGSAPTANENADALLDRANGIESTLTPRQALRLLVAACAGKLTMTPTSATFRNFGDTADRIDAVVDADGNRTSITYDLG